MQQEENQQNKNNEQSEQQANKAASEQMNRNDAEQNEHYREKQNEITKSTNSDNDPDALSNKQHRGESSDSVSIEDQNKRKLENEEDADFGNEQLQ